MEKPTLKDVIFKVSLSERITLGIMSFAMVVVGAINHTKVFDSWILWSMFLTACFIFGYQVAGLLIYLYKKKFKKDLVE